MNWSKRSASRCIGAGAAGLFLSGILAGAAPASAAEMFFSFQTTTSGSNGAYSSAVTAETFPGIPTFSHSSGWGGNSGSETSFTAYDGTTWLGSGNNGLPGQSVTSTNTSSEARSFTLTFSMEDLENLSLRMALRSAGSGAVTAFSDVTYSVNGGSAVSFGFDAAQRAIVANGTFQEKTFDFSAFSAIENQETVAITWHVAGVPTASSLRVDNLQATATLVPEPATATLLLAASGALLRRRRGA